MVFDVASQEIVDLPKRNTWADYLFRPALLTIMITCVSLSLVAFGRSMVPEWWGGHFLIAMVLVTIEAIYSFRIRLLPQSRGISAQRFRLVEFGLLALALKFVTYLGQPWNEVWLNISTMISQPSAFFTASYMVTVVLGLLVWVVAYGTMVDFEGLYDPVTFRSETLTPMQRLTTRFYWGGGLLILFSGMTLAMGDQGVSGLMILTRIDRTQVGGVVLNALVYFLLGLVMLSQVRLTTLMTRWTMQKVTVADGLGKAWAKYGFAFLLLIALLVLFLPTRYSLGLFDSVVLGFSFLSSLLFQIVQIIMFILTIPLALLMSLFGGGEATPPPPAAGFAGFPPIEEVVSREAVPWYEVLKSLVFWILFLSVAIYFIRAYLADHPELLASLKRLRPIRWLMGFVTTFVGWLTQMFKAGVDLIPKEVDLQSKFAPTGKTRKKRWIWSLSKNLSAREQILYYYLNMLKRADESGLQRPISNTPYEYEPKLGQSLPDVENDVNLITEAFVHARYSRDEFDGEHAAMVKTVWQRVQTALRDYNQPADEDEIVDEDLKS